jgi:hypothetical protein
VSFPAWGFVGLGGFVGSVGVGVVVLRMVLVVLRLVVVVLRL